MSNYYIGNIVCANDLSHHGIIGQRWGVRRYQNPDGTLTAEGRIRYGSGKEQKKLYNRIKSGYSKYGPFKMMSKLANEPQVKHASKELSSAAIKTRRAFEKQSKEIDNFYNNKNLHNKYIDKAVEVFMKKYGESNPNLSRKQIKDMYLFGDLDQGEDSSFQLYIRSGEPGALKIIRNNREYLDSQKTLKSAAEKYVKEFLGEYGDTKFINSKDGPYWSQRSAGDLLTDLLVNRSFDDIER